ncbi:MULTISPECIES: DUF6624 domain-containing protein [Pontibacter]|uniref:DUF6624 domain-containing protein n=1 Tax=Pontibacter TaxID=323449 RepID=UPI002027DCA6|nr:MULTISPECIES: DUF6624 domain-containing protein [Pontibacter]
MKKLLCCLVMLLCLSLMAKAQTPAEAFAKYEAKEYKASAEMYDKILKGGKGSSTDHYNAACSWALAGNKDKAFAHLSKSIEKGWYNISHLKKDSDLNSLHADKRWNPLVHKLQAKLDKEEANYNKPLKAQLERIYETDQYYRGMIDSVQNRFGMESPEMKELWKKMAAQDSLNTIEVVAILEKHGWPGKSMVGPQASMAAFLVIQHSEKSVMEKYLPMLREAAQKGEALKGSLALMEDRVRMNKGLPQLYGSQLQMNETTKKWELYKEKTKPTWISAAQKWAWNLSQIT